MGAGCGAGGRSESGRKPERGSCSPLPGGHGATRGGDTGGFPAVTPPPVPQVNGLESVRVPMSVVKFLRPKTKRYKHWLAQQQARRAELPL